MSRTDHIMKSKIIISVGILICVAALARIALPTALHKAGLHPDYSGPRYEIAAGKKALIIGSNHATLNAPGKTDGDATGVAISEISHPYYSFLEAGMQVDVASINGGNIPVDPMSLKFFIISEHDERYLEDPTLQAKMQNSLAVGNLDMRQYDVVFIAGGWGAAYDLGYSPELASKISEAYYAEHQPVIAGVCHGVLGLINAKDRDGHLLIAGRRMTGVTDKQIKELGVAITPLHPETELKKAGAKFESETAFRDFFATHVVVDDEKRFVTGQNQNSGLEAAHKVLMLLAQK
jgi:putative intracellular protease/amidase